MNDKDNEILEAELLTEVKDGVTIEHKSIDKNLTEMKGDSYHLKKLTLVTIIFIAIFTISYTIGKSEEGKREEDCVEETKEDYGVAPSHTTYVTCTTSEKTGLQSFSETIAFISLLFSLVFIVLLWVQYDSMQQLREKERQLENAERIRLGIENQAKKFEEENDYLSAITAWRELNMEDEAIRVMKNQADELEKHKNYSSAITIWRELNMEDEAIRVMKNQAYEREKARDYEPAIHIWENIGEIEEAARVRKLQAELGSVKLSQKVVHGDEISQTEIKDSVLNRSNVGGGSSKMQELEKLTTMKEKGLISDEEYEKMKREIIG